MYQEEGLFDFRCVDSWWTNFVILLLYSNVVGVCDSCALARGSLGQCTGAGMHARLGCSGMRRFCTGIYYECFLTFEGRVFLCDHIFQYLKAIAELIHFTEFCASVLVVVVGLCGCARVRCAWRCVISTCEAFFRAVCDTTVDATMDVAAYAFVPLWFVVVWLCGSRSGGSLQSTGL